VLAPFALDLAGGLARAAGAPARRAEDMGQGGARRTGSWDILTDGDPIVKGCAGLVEIAEILDHAKPAGFVGALGLEGGELPVPDDQNARVVAVEVARVPCVVHPVVRGGVEHRLDRRRQLADHLGVEPELIGWADTLPDGVRRRREADEGQRQPHHPGPGQAAGPGLPQGGGEVVVLRGLVVDVRRPPKSPLVAEPVEPVAGQVLQEKDGHPCPDCGHRDGG
jgi:hypothetical protein